MIQLDERLQLAEELAGPCDTLIDVGSNHGFLPVHMLLRGQCRRALLCDVSADALRRARGLVELTGLADRAQLRVTDGLCGLDPQPGDVVTICGMGARTIAHILDRTLPCPVVMQANVELNYLRRHIECVGMHIAKEGIAHAAGRYYVVLRAEPGAAAPLTEQEARLGPVLLREKPPLWEGYLRWRLGVARRALEGVRSGSDEEKLRRALEEARFVEQALQEVERA